jgi:tetratricopeptide (TPR) repeat protein
VRATLSLFLWSLVVTPAFSSLAVQTPSLLTVEQRWKAAHEAGMNATEEGLYSQAVNSFRIAIEEAEKFGSTDPRLAQSINSLAAAQRLSGNYGEAIALSRRSLAILEKAYGAEHPNVAISQNNLALTLRLHGDYDEARALSERSLSIFEKALGPRDVNVAITLNNLVQVYLLQKKYDAAEPLARRSLSILERAPETVTSNLLQSLENLAQVCRELGKYDESEQLYRSVLSVRWGAGSDIIPILDRFAEVLDLAFIDKDLKEAQEAFQAAPGWNGIGLDLYILMAGALRDRGLSTEPEDVLRRAIQRFPDSLEARYALAQVYAEAHKWQAALDTLQDTTKVKRSGDPGRDRYVRSRIYQEISGMHVNLFQFNEALSNFQTAIALDPGNARALVDLGDLYLRTDKLEDAAAQYAQAILLTGGDAAAYYGIAEANRRLGRYPQAVVAADKALGINPRDAKSSYVRSLALLRDGHREEGETELERFERLEAIERDEAIRGRAIPVALRTAFTKLEERQGEAAIQVLREAIHTYPDSPSLQLNFGIIQSRLGMHQDALKTFQAMSDQGFQDYFLAHMNLSREYEALGDRKASQLHRLIYLQKFDAFLNRRK